MTDANGHPVSMVGAHGIGDPDGNAMPVTHWSTTGGDLRVPHFVGMHAIQVLLLIVGALGVLATRTAWLRDDRVRARIVGTAALGYTGVFAVLGWQAKRGQSVAHPDKATLIALAGVAALTLASATAVVTTARRHRPGPLSSRLLAVHCHPAALMFVALSERLGGWQTVYQGVIEESGWAPETLTARPTWMV